MLLKLPVKHGQGDLAVLHWPSHGKAGHLWPTKTLGLLGLKEGPHHGGQIGPRSGGIALLTQALEPRGRVAIETEERFGTADVASQQKRHSATPLFTGSSRIGSAASQKGKSWAWVAFMVPKNNSREPSANKFIMIVGSGNSHAIMHR